MGNYGPQNSSAEKKWKIAKNLLFWILFLSFNNANSDSKVQRQLWIAREYKGICSEWNFAIGTV